MPRRVILTREDSYCDLITFYENVAKKLSFKVTDNTEFDCRKICVSKSVQEAIGAYYREQEDIVDSDIVAVWLICGPKTNIDEKNNQYTACVESGFVLSR